MFLSSMSFFVHTFGFSERWLYSNLDLKIIRSVFNATATYTHMTECTAMQCNRMQCSAMQCIPLHSVALHSIALQCIIHCVSKKSM